MSTFLMILSLGFLAFGVFVIIRSKQVLNFRLFINRVSHQYSVKHPDEWLGGWDRFYNKMPEYGSMLYSLKKISLETYFSQEEIELMKNNLENNEDSRWFRK